MSECRNYRDLGNVSKAYDAVSNRSLSRRHLLSSGLECRGNETLLWASIGPPIPAEVLPFVVAPLARGRAEARRAMHSQARDCAYRRVREPLLCRPVSGPRVGAKTREPSWHGRQRPPLRRRRSAPANRAASRPSLRRAPAARRRRPTCSSDCSGDSRSGSSAPARAWRTWWCRSVGLDDGLADVAGELEALGPVTLPLDRHDHMQAMPARSLHPRLRAPTSSARRARGAPP